MPSSAFSAQASSTNEDTNVTSSANRGIIRLLSYFDRGWFASPNLYFARWTPDFNRGLDGS